MDEYKEARESSISFSTSIHLSLQSLFEFNARVILFSFSRLFDQLPASISLPQFTSTCLTHPSIYWESFQKQKWSPWKASSIFGPWDLYSQSPRPWRPRPHKQAYSVRGRIRHSVTLAQFFLYIKSDAGFLSLSLSLSGDSACIWESFQYYINRRKIRICMHFASFLYILNQNPWSSIVAKCFEVINWYWSLQFRRRIGSGVKYFGKWAWRGVI